MPSLTLKETLDTLKKLGHEPRHGLGQNFLVDKNIVEKSVLLAQLKPGEQVVEVGPGLGTLTSAILEKGARLSSIEQDKSLRAHLEDTFTQEQYPGFEILWQDATRVDYGQFKRPCKNGEKNEDGEFKIVANLPYAVSSILLEKFLQALPSKMVLMVQLELAERYLAATGKKFSALSIFLQSAYQLKIAHRVSRSCFFPRPGVDSCLLVLDRRAQPIIFAPQAQKLIREMFLNRRKQLKKAALEQEAAAAWFEGLVTNGKIKETARAEEIPTELWQQLAKN